jgi:hypothetical protein
LVTYVNAAVDVSADLLVGFSGKEFWLPELTIALPRDTFGTDIVEFRMDERFGENLRPGLEDYIRNRVSRDVEAYLEPLVTDRPEMRMAAFPGAITTFLQLYNGIPVAVTEALGALAVYRQSGGSKSLEYTVTESLVYWNIDMEEGVSNFLFPE